MGSEVEAVRGRGYSGRFCVLFHGQTRRRRWRRRTSDVVGDLDEAQEELVSSAVMGLVEGLPEFLNTRHSLVDCFLYALETRFHGGPRTALRTERCTSRWFRASVTTPIGSISETRRLVEELFGGDP
jgi:hypothetical protein